MAGNLLSGLMKGLSSVLPQDDSDVKIMTAQTKVKELQQQQEEVYARLGRQVMEANGAEAYPEVAAKLNLLQDEIAAAQGQLQAAKDEKDAAEKAAAQAAAGRTCPNCGTENAEGTNFCQDCGTKLGAAAPAASFCLECGAELKPGSRFCGGCGAKVG